MGRGRRRSSPLLRNERRDFWLFLSPWIIGFTCFGAGPIVASFLLSFTDYSIFQPPNWVGLGNYAELFASDPLILKAFWNTLFYTFFAVPLGTTASLCVALLLNQKVRGLPVWRTLFYLPSVVSGVIEKRTDGWVITQFHRSVAPPKPVVVYSEHHMVRYQ